VVAASAFPAPGGAWTTLPTHVSAREPPLSVGQGLIQAFALAKNQQASLYETWILISHRVGSQLPASLLFASIQRDGEIFTQFSTPAERALKWAGMRKALKPGGLLIIQGYTPKQLAYGTGGPKQLDQLYTRPMLEKAFAGFQSMIFTEEELEMHEGTAHSGMSAVIGLTCQKPQ
jgi:hypothetical protein